MIEESPPIIRKRYSKLSYHIESMNSSFSSLNNEQEANETSDDMLGFIKNFSLEKIKPTLKEQLLIDEEELNQLHLNHRKNRKFISSLNHYNSVISKDSESTMDKSMRGFNSEIDDSQLMLEQFLKIIMIGDKQVGKTTFRNKILEDLSSPCNPTYSLEIRKRLLESKRSTVRMEIWDTSSQTQNSILMKSKYFIFEFQLITKFVAFSFSFVISTLKTQ